MPLRPHKGKKTLHHVRQTYFKNLRVLESTSSYLSAKNVPGRVDIMCDIPHSVAPLFADADLDDDKIAKKPFLDQTRNLGLPTRSYAAALPVRMELGKIDNGAEIGKSAQCSSFLECRLFVIE